MRMFLAALAAVVLVVGGYYAALLVAPLAVLNLFPADHREVAYGPLSRQRMDVYRNDWNSDAPTVVFFHGGNWDTGSKEDYAFVATGLVELGFRVVVPNYRLEPFPTFMEDAALAVKVANENAYPRFYLMGHSAGAHIAALLALDPRYLDRVGLDRCEVVDGWIGLSGPYDFLPITSERTARTFPPQTRPESQPLAFAKAPAPPALLIHGTADETVHAEDTVLLGAALEKVGVPVETILLEGKEHRDTIAAFGRGLGWIADVRGPVQDFLLNGPKGCR